MKALNSYEGKSDCEFLSNVISVDTKNDNYDLLMSYSTSDVNNLLVNIQSKNLFLE